MTLHALVSMQTVLN